MAGVEPAGEKKPKAKLPSSDTMVAPGESGLAGTILSSASHGGSRKRRRRAAAQAIAQQTETVFLMNWEKKPLLSSEWSQQTETVTATSCGKGMSVQRNAQRLSYGGSNNSKRIRSTSDEIRMHMQRRD